MDEHNADKIDSSILHSHKLGWGGILSFGVGRLFVCSLGFFFPCLIYECSSGYLLMDNKFSFVSSLYLNTIRVSFDMIGAMLCFAFVLIVLLFLYLCKYESLKRKTYIKIYIKILVDVIYLHFIM